MRWREVLILAALAPCALAPGAARAADDTGKICAVALSSGRSIGEALGAGSAGAIANAVKAKNCQPGDALEVTYAEGNPAPVIAQFCDLGRHVYLYAPPPNYAQVGITSELVCSLVARRTGR